MPRARTLEIRDPIHGFIELSPWEWDVVNHPVFQRLRRIRQLAWTEMVYPGAVHTRFEHSLGVMHTASRMFDQICVHRGDLLRELNFSAGGIDKDRKTVRLAALLHDVGHAPFSHAGEDLMPADPGTGRRFKHEEYSAALIRTLMADVIDHHPHNDLAIRAEEVAALIDGSVQSRRMLFWRQLSQASSTRTARTTCYGTHITWEWTTAGTTSGGSSPRSPRLKIRMRVGRCSRSRRAAGTRPNRCSGRATRCSRRCTCTRRA